MTRTEVAQLARRVPKREADTRRKLMWGVYVGDPYRKPARGLADGRSGIRSARCMGLHFGGVRTETQSDIIWSADDQNVTRTCSLPSSLDYLLLPKEG